MARNKMNSDFGSAVLFCLFLIVFVFLLFFYVKILDFITSVF